MKILNIKNFLTFFLPSLDFRVNKYCGELLQIGNEDWDLRKNINWTEILKNNQHRNDVDDDDGSGEGPKIAALRNNDLNYYQNMNLRIIKADKNESAMSSSPALQGKNASEIKFPRQYEGGGTRDKPRSKVYSQVIQNVQKGKIYHPLSI